MKFRIKFEFYYQKMQTDITADTEEQAKEKVISRLKFVSIKKIGKPDIRLGDGGCEVRTTQAMERTKDENG